MTKLLYRALSFAAVCVIGHADEISDEIEDSTVGLEPRLRVGVSALHGVTSKFSNLGVAGFVSNPGSSIGGAEERFYDDGFNRVDISGNAGDLTSYWGYSDSGQYDGSSIGLSSLATTGRAEAKEDEDFIPGVEVGLDYPLGGALDVEWIDEWGMSLLFQWHRIDIDSSSAVASGTMLVEDSYSTNGAVPPAGPYAGSFTGPGFLLGSVPDRSISSIPGGGLVEGKRSIDADLFGLNLGPYARVRLNDCFTLNLSAGAILAYMNSDYQYKSSSSIAGDVTGSISGRDNDEDFLWGAYARVGGEYRISQFSNLYFDIGYRKTEDFEQEVNGSRAEVEFDSVVTVSAGFSRKF